MNQIRSEPVGQTDFSDLEIRILKREEEGYPVDITLKSGEVERGYVAAELASWEPGGDPAADGQHLFDTLFADKELRGVWGAARVQASQRRIRLRIDPGAAELHALPWELMHSGQAMLSAQAETPFSRFLPIFLPWSGPVEERPIRVLVAISNPDDLGTLQQAPVDVDLERKTLLDALGDVDPGELELDFLETLVTLERLEETLRGSAQGGGGYHVLHYVGHGIYNEPRGQAFLYMQSEDGNTDPVPDDALSGMLARQQVRPWLVVLAACQSASRSTSDAFAGLGPKLIKVGVPAVVAMQETVSVETARKFSATFYPRLLAHGYVDQAVNEARSTLLTAGRPDAAVPVLFMRLKSGQLWGSEADADARGEMLGEESSTFWKDLVFKIKHGKCIPIIGPRAHGRWLPTPAEVAEEWAEEHGYPFSDKRELARVAQYLVTRHQKGMPPLFFLETLSDTLKERLPDELRPQPRPSDLTSFVQAVGWQNLVAEDPNEVHQVLASLDIPLYLTTNCDSFLWEALRAQGKEPQREICHWNEDLSGLGSLFDKGDYKPTWNAPLVYHLFGSDERPDSLVLAEDDYLDFLVKTSAQRDRIPEYIRGKLASSSLLFVGYTLHDWEFRVIMRGLVATLDRRFPVNHVAVQLEERDAGDMVAVREFLQKHFFRATQIDVYWGTTAQFMAELREHWEEARR